MAITYVIENEVKVPKFSKRKVNKWIKEVLSLYDKKAGELSYVFCDDKYILDINKTYLNHDYYTDIITFDYCEEDIISGDLIISIDTVASNSQKFAVDFEEEFYRVLIHGILHLCGINDKGPGEREVMEAKENEALQLLSKK